MKIAICLDYNTNTIKILSAAKHFISELKTADVTVIHVIDEMLFSTATGFETELSQTLANESRNLKELCQSYFGNDITYVEDYGIPRLKLDEVLAGLEYDVLIIGCQGVQGFAERIMGGVAEHLQSHSRKPVLIIPTK